MIKAAYCSFCSMSLGESLSDLFPEAGRVATHTEQASVSLSARPNESPTELQPESRTPDAEPAPESPTGVKRLSLLRRREEKRRRAAEDSKHAEPEPSKAVPWFLPGETDQGDEPPRAQKQMLALPPSLLAPAADPVVAVAPVLSAVTPAPVALGEDYADYGVEERTILAVPTRSAVHRYLQFSTGLRVTITGTGVVGREPRTDETVTHIVQIVDTTRKLSRTHFRFGIDGDDVWVEDLASGNGTWAIDVPGTPGGQLTANTRYTLAPGAVFECGDIRITLHVDEDTPQSP
ncbi:FHA domain-containing protein [Leifsonia aquatica]|uniref:FHA domain-containing protein n=1 Tax=Leifsonia aquatica TaxID=144185 RepID=UPI0038502BFD